MDRRTGRDAVTAPATLPLAGKVAVVTGAAGGIGRAAAAALGASGARVAMLDREAVDATLPGAVTHLAVQADVSLESEVARAFAEVVASAGRVDIVVNSAGLAIRQAAVEQEMEAWNRVVAVNMNGTFLCAREGARHMIAQGSGGAIVNIGSIMSFSGGGLYPNISYQTTKGAIVNMTRALAVEWAPHDIRVNGVAPTYVRTGFVAPLLAQPDLVNRIEAMTPLRRLAEPEDVAAAIVFLAGPGATMITGHVLPVDGGFLAQ